MSAFLNDAAPIVVLGAATGPRADAFQAALKRFGRAPAAFFSFDRFLSQPDAFEAALRLGGALRFDSPDRERAGLIALYRLGAETAAEEGYAVLEGNALEARLAQPGAIGSPAQLAFGLELALKQAATMAAARGARLLAKPSDVALSFDKTACAAHLAERGIAVPRQIGPVADFDELIERMRSARLSRAFVKLRFGSSAAGMTALALGPGGAIVAHTTAVIGEDGVPRATRDVRRLIHHAHIRSVIDALAPLGLHAEAWLPKAGAAGGVADLRLIVVDGEPVFNVMRVSPHPMTNLHLGGARRSPDALRARVGEAAWRALIESCRAVSRAFPSCFVLGVDAAILAGDRRHAVFEVNAFGDHVKGVAYQGCTPQEWQVLRYRRSREAA
jgi:hypothetical protein